MCVFLPTDTKNSNQDARFILKTEGRNWVL